MELDQHSELCAMWLGTEFTNAEPNANLTRHLCARNNVSRLESIWAAGVAFGKMLEDRILRMSACVSSGAIDPLLKRYGIEMEAGFLGRNRSRHFHDG
jgi:hypothetical protein